MTRLIIGSAHRVVPSSQLSGFLYIIDLESRSVLKKTEGIDPPFRDFDINPRGGMRGMRGIAARSGEVALANYSSIFFFDPNWNLTRVLSHPVCSSIHELIFDGKDVLVVSTGTDHLLDFDENNNINRAWFVHDQTDLVRRARIKRASMTSAEIMQSGIDFRDRRKFRTEEFDHTHLNSLSKCPNGDVLLSLGLIVDTPFSALMELKSIFIKYGIWPWILNVNRAIRNLLHLKKQKLTELVIQPSRWGSAIVRVSPDGSSKLLLLLDGMVNPSHSVRVLSDGTAIYLDTSHGAVLHFEIETGTMISRTEISDQFLRGAVELPDGTFALGSGNEVLIYDLRSCKVLDRIVFSDNPAESVHGLDILPPEFILPPDSLQSHLGQIVDFDGQNVVWDRSSIHADSYAHP